MVRTEIRAVIFNCSRRNGRSVAQTPTRNEPPPPSSVAGWSKGPGGIPCSFPPPWALIFLTLVAVQGVGSRRSSPSYCYYRQKFSAGGACTLHKAPASGAGLGLDFFFFFHFQRLVMK